ncbi:hypothetical protein GOP47_0030168 [Adiantum capillus-veneris]|nr:hypothetical protein GOP47_0030168 [Adiantum capillus-veneris]
MTVVAVAALEQVLRAHHLGIEPMSASKNGGCFYKSSLTDNIRLPSSNCLQHSGRNIITSAQTLKGGQSSLHIVKRALSQSW